MNKIPNFFRKRKEEQLTSPTKEILTQPNIDRIRIKISTEITAAELKIAAIVNKSANIKAADQREIERLETEIRNLTSKFSELLDPKFDIYTEKRASIGF